MLGRHFHGLDFSVEVKVEVLAGQVRYGRFDAHGGAFESMKGGGGKQRMVLRRSKCYRHIGGGRYAEAGAGRVY
jgi:hypothetical protein